MRLSAIGATGASMLLMLTPFDAASSQARRAAPVERRATRAVEALPRASISVPGPVYMMTTTTATIHVQNLANAPHRLTITGETLECWLSVPSMSEHEVKPVAGRATFTVPLHFIYPEAHGQTCTIRVKAYNLAAKEGRTISAGTIKVEPAQQHVIEDTWSIVPWTSGTTPTLIVDPGSSGGRGACSGVSAGLSGLVPIGPVEHERDLSFHIRSGLNPSSCVFDSNPPYHRLKAGWAIVDRKWKIEQVRGASDACRVVNYGTGYPEGTNFYVHSQLECGGGPDNDNGVRLTLQRLTLLGPANGSPLDAFISGSH
jgi:hypothetical protein